MNQRPLIPGGTLASAPSPRSSEPPRLRGLGFVIVLWLLAGVAFLIYKVGAAKTQPAEATTKTAPTRVNGLGIDDLAYHMNDAEAKITDATAKIRRADAHIERTMPGLDRNFLLVEKQHIQNARALDEAARQDLEEAHRELDLILSSLRKDNLQ